MKEALKCPRDETNPVKLEMLLQAVRREVEGERTVYIANVDEIEQLANAVMACPLRLLKR